MKTFGDYLKAKYPEGHYGISYDELELMGLPRKHVSGWVPLLWNKPITEILRARLVELSELTILRISKLAVAGHGIGEAKQKRLQSTINGLRYLAPDRVDACVALSNTFKKQLDQTKAAQNRNRQEKRFAAKKKSKLKKQRKKEKKATEKAERLAAVAARASERKANRSRQKKTKQPPSNGIKYDTAFQKHEAIRAPRLDRVDPTSDAFLQSYEWRRLRLQTLKKYGATCQCCGASPATGAVINVDHIKPRRIFPHLALDIDNTQVMCHDCNHGKGNWDMTDWRPFDAETYDPSDEFNNRFGGPTQ